jgi:hypothetical protein
MNVTALHNYSAEQIADRLGELDLVAKGAKEEADKLKSEIKRREINAVRGDRFILTVSNSVTKRLDTKKLEGDIGKDTLADYYKETPTTTIRVKPAPISVEDAA